MKVKIFCILVFALSVHTVSSQVNVPFDSDKWMLPEGQAQIENYLGEKSLFLTAGIAYLKDTEMRNGIIEFDIAVPETRGFAGAIFRQTAPDNYEEFYLRMHQSGNPDATQYTPVFNGLAGWQLYFGPGFSESFSMDFDQWMHVKIVIWENQGEIYVRDMEKPLISMHDLKQEPSSGRMGLKVNPGLAPAHYANFRYQVLDSPPFPEKTIETTTPPKGLIKKWMVSRAFPEVWFDKFQLHFKESDLPARDWTILKTEPDGLANFSRITPRPVENNTVFARLVLTASETHIQPLEFGFSDRVRVYVNGTIIFSGNDAYITRDYRFLGSIGYFDTVFLPLKKGRNDILIAVSEGFGGWGLRGKLLEPEKVIVE
ncbi:MAG: hypothetical protein R3C61_21865 [Bacteroidia bacterium]